jgi:hypothetical protein
MVIASVLVVGMERPRTLHYLVSNNDSGGNAWNRLQSR